MSLNPKEWVYLLLLSALLLRSGTRCGRVLVKADCHRTVDIRRNIHAVGLNLRLLEAVQPHAPINPRTGIPTGIRRFMIDANRQHIIPRVNKVRFVKLESRVAVFPLARLIHIYKNTAVHINAIKAHRSSSAVVGNGYRAAVPTGGILVQIIRVI